jgi:hypothetical protein
MKRLHLLRFAFILGLLCASLGVARAQNYADVTAVPTNKWTFSVVDVNFNPVAAGTLQPNTRYYLHFRLNAGVSVDNLAAYIITEGDGWYEPGTTPPQTFFTGIDARSPAASYPTRYNYFAFITEGPDDFSGAYFKARLSATGLIVGQPTGSTPKAGLF